MEPVHLQMIAAVMITILVILTALHVLFSMKEESEWATFWLLLILAVPFAGAILYLLAGVSRKNTYGKKILFSVRNLLTEQNRLQQEKTLLFKESLRKFYQHEQSGIYPVEQVLDRLLAHNPEHGTAAGITLPEQQYMLHSCSGNSIQLFCDGTEAYPAMLKAIRNAKHHIHLQSYIFANDPAGRAILAALRERAGAGVEVKVLFDRLGSFISAWHLLRCTTTGNHDNFHIRPFSHSSLLSPWRLQLRNHRKLLIVDGKTAFTGGLNISHENVRTSTREGIHDFHCRIQGPSVGQLQYAFLGDWKYASGQKPLDLDIPAYFPAPVPHGNNRIRVMPSGHGYYFKGTEKVFLTAAATARKSIWIITPYFVPPHVFSEALRMASARNVDVRIIVPAHSDHWYMKLASAHYYETQIAGSVRIFERQGVFSHAKAMLVDGQWAYLGSSNCDSRSFRLNFELDLLIGDGDFPGILYQQFLREFEQCKEITPETVKYTPGRKLLQSLCALACPVL